MKSLRARLRIMVIMMGLFDIGGNTLLLLDDGACIGMPLAFFWPF